MNVRDGTTNLARLTRAWLACAGVDALWAVVLTLAYGRTLLSLWQGVAAVPFGASMREGGLATALVGLGVHATVALTWSTVFLFLYLGSSWVRHTIASRRGALLVAFVYGPAIWVVMSAVVVPALTHQPLVVTYRWWIQLAGHATFVGAPIVWGFRWAPAVHAPAVAA